MNVRLATANDTADWVRMRTALWPEHPEDHPPEIKEFFASPRNDLATFVVEDDNGTLCGFLEAGTRSYAEGCLSSPVGYIEGWWVDPEHRQQGIGTLLVAAAEEWARNLGLTEMASDADINNDVSQAAHRALGYEEADKLVCFAKKLHAR